MAPEHGERAIFEWTVGGGPPTKSQIQGGVHFKDFPDYKMSTRRSAAAAAASAPAEAQAPKEVRDVKEVKEAKEPPPPREAKEVPPPREPKDPGSSRKRARELY